MLSFKKRILILSLVVCLQNILKSQTNSGAISRTLTPEQVTELFNEYPLTKQTIKFPIYKVYQFNDNTGVQYAVLTEKPDSTNKTKEIINEKIQALCFKKESNELKKIWEINDFALKNTNNKVETSIWFWTKYCRFEDIDKDGKIEPVIVYGTSGGNGKSDGRIKIIINYKNIKYVIRHQNGELDFERRTEIDKAFYLLPKEIQKFVKGITTSITSDNNAIFPYDWQKGMDKQQTILKE
jgi:hypothetical protein